MVRPSFRPWTWSFRHGPFLCPDDRCINFLRNVSVYPNIIFEANASHNSQFLYSVCRLCFALKTFGECILIIVQRDATQSSLFIILHVHSTCFGCQPHPSSGVHKTVTTASGTGHIFVQLLPSTVAKLAWPRWREVAAQYRRL